MPASGTQFRRLLFIDQELQQDRFPNCRTLAEKWEVSAKTIQRDIDYLRDQLSAPIAYDDQKHGFYYSEPSFRLPGLNVSESDLFAVCIAEKALRQFENTPLHSKLAGVFARIEASLPSQTHIDPSWVQERILFFEAPTTRMSQPTWETLASAIRFNQRVALSYSGPNEDGAITKRTVEPYYLVNFRNEWYLSSFCCKRKAIRTFAVSRIRSATPLNERFTFPESLSPDELFGDHFGIRWNAQWHDVAIHFTRSIAPYISERTWHPRQTLEHHKDGSVTLRFRTNHLDEVRNWILSWGADARALCPPTLSESIKDSLRATLENYN